MDDFLTTFDPSKATLETLLEKEIEGLREENAALRAENKMLREELERQGGPPPWVKPNVALANKKAKEKAQQARKKRTQSLVRKHRLGVRLMSLIGMLRSSCRVPVRTIQTLLKSVYGLWVSMGEIVNTLHLIAQRGAKHVEDLLKQIGASPFLHADETGWRESGQNGYLWSFSTPTMRYFQYDCSRASKIPIEVIGAIFSGHVVSDFYGAYNNVSGFNQRCWVHLLRDLDKLVQMHPQDKSVQEWVQQIRDLYHEAILYQRQCLNVSTLSCVPTGYNALQHRDRRSLRRHRLSWRNA